MFGLFVLSLLFSCSFQDEKMNVEALSRAELLSLLSILEGELEAQDFVIHALRVSRYTHTHICLWSQNKYKYHDPINKNMLFCLSLQ